jgi:hypothetical protein
MLVMGAVILTAALPAAAQGAVVRMAPDGALRIDGFEAREERVTVRYEATGGGASAAEPRFVITDLAGVFAIAGSSCRVTDVQTVTCDAIPVARISAGLAAGNDTLTVDPGVPANYVVDASGGAGNDVIQSAGADDELRGDDGRDVLGGGAGDDRLIGGSGSDGLIGFEGDDELRGGKGRDALFGLAGRDSFRGGAGNDAILARDKRRDALLDCGPGSFQRAVRDRIDPRPRNCLRRKKTGKGQSP